MLVRRISAILGMVVVTFLVLSAGSIRAGWTQDYDCDEAFWVNEHKVDPGLTEWSAGTHGYIPGDCSVHENYGSGGGDDPEPVE